MPDLTLFDVVLQWLKMGDYYENNSFQSPLYGLKIENLKKSRGSGDDRGI